MSRYRVSFDKHGETAQRLPKEVDSADDVQIVHDRLTGWRAVFYLEERNQRDAITAARKRLGEVSAPSLYWHLNRAGDAP